MPPVPGMGRASKMRKEDVRLTQANMYRVLSANLPEGSLVKNAVSPATAPPPTGLARPRSHRVWNDVAACGCTGG